MQTSFNKRLVGVTTELANFAARMTSVKDKFNTVNSNSTKLAVQIGQVEELVSQIAEAEKKQAAGGQSSPRKQDRAQPQPEEEKKGE